MLQQNYGLLKNPSFDFNLTLPDPAKFPVLPNITLPQIPQIPEIPALPQVNGDGYKNIAKILIKL